MPTSQIAEKLGKIFEFSNKNMYSTIPVALIYGEYAPTINEPKFSSIPKLSVSD
jgi:hypothetical protein